MKVVVRITRKFKAAAKPLIKKYPSFLEDIARLEDQLIDNPRLGTSLGMNAYKIRMQIKSKGKGKSGGARVISLLEAEVVGLVDYKADHIIVNLVTIYDKGDIATLSDKELRNLISALH